MANYSRTYNDTESDACYYTGPGGVYFVEEDGNGGFDVYSLPEREKRRGGVPMRRFPCVMPSKGGPTAHGRACAVAEAMADGKAMMIYPPRQSSHYRVAGPRDSYASPCVKIAKDLTPDQAVAKAIELFPDHQIAFIA